MQTLVDALDRAAERWPDRTAWRFDPGLALTFAEAAELSRRYAAALAPEVAAGDRVLVMLDNQVEFPVVWLALMRLGAAMVPLNVGYRRVDTTHVVTLTHARLAVTSAAYAPLLASVGVAIVDVADLDRGDADPPFRPLTARTPVNVQFTSGTTGPPKGCVLTHDYWLTLARSLVAEFPQLGDSDVMLTAQRFSYLDPQWNVAAGLLAGAEVVVLDGFHPTTYWAKVREHRATYAYLLASMPTMLLRTPPDPQDGEHRLRAVQCSAIPPTLHAELETRWGVPWYEAFGMTETGADLRVGPSEHDELVGSGCLGRPASHREVQLSPVGELLLRGPGMMAGYLDEPEATATAFDGGWFHTGDLARLDDHGRVYLIGRLKDMIRRSGENIAAREVEDVLLSHPAVRMAAVVGVPDALRGEEVRAYVVGGPTLDLVELHAFCSARLARFKVPRYWSVHDDLPRTPSERVAKAALASLHATVVDLAGDS